MRKIVGNHLLLLSLIVMIVWRNAAMASNDSVVHPSFQSAGLKIHYGKLIDIYPNYPSSNGVFAVEGDWNLHCTGAKPWNKYYGFPETGVSLIYTNFGNSDVLGFSIATYPHITLASKISEKFFLKYKLGLGLAFFNKPFDEVTNPDNFVIGGNFSSIATCSMYAQYKVNWDFFLTTGLSFLHYSNGHTKVPNVGANSFTANIGVKYLISPEIDYRQTPSEKIKAKDKIHFGLSLGLGIQEFEGGEFPSGGPKYPVYVGSVYLTSKLGIISKLSTGLDFNYYTYYHDFLISNHLFKNQEKLRSFSVVYYIGHEFLFGRLSVLTQVGLNIYNPFNVQASNYNVVFREKPNLYSSNKFGFRYYFSPLYLRELKPSAYMGLNIKSHVGVADFVEFSIGYLF